MERSALHSGTTEPRTGEAVWAGVASALLFSLLPVFPLLLPLAVVSPFPVIVLRLRGSSLMPAAMSAVLAAVLVGALFSPGEGVSFFLVLLLPGLVLGQTMARGRGLVRGSALAFGTLGLEIALALLFAGARMSEGALAPFQWLRSPEFLQQMRTSGMPAEQIQEWQDQVAGWARAMAVVYPAVWVIVGALVVMANAVLLRSYLARRDPGWLEGGEFESIRWPLALPVTFVLAGAAVAVPVLQRPAYNTLLVLAFFFALQGLAVVLFYARRLAGPPLLRTALLLLVLVNPWAKEVLALLGLFDAWIDFRKYAEPPKPAS